MNLNWADAFIAQWQREGVSLFYGASEAQIQAAVGSIDFQFPEDFKTLYRRINGFRDLDWLESMVSIWPLERIVTGYSERADADFVAFADFLIESHRFGFIRGRQGIYKYDGNPMLFADSFEEAILKFNSNSEEVY